MVSIPLPPAFEAWAQNEVEAGRAADIESVARDALEGHRKAQETAQLAAFRASLDEAEQSIREGKGIPADLVFAELRAAIRNAADSKS